MGSHSATPQVHKPKEVNNGKANLNLREMPVDICGLTFGQASFSTQVIAD
jgi:hypothetical protein